MDAVAKSRPRLKAFLEPVADGRDGLILLRETGHEWLPHPVFVDLIPFLDGCHDIETIFSQLGEHYSSATILNALETLEHRGALAEDGAGLPKPLRAFWEERQIVPGLAEKRLAETRVAVQVLGDISGQDVEDCLRGQGLHLDPAGEVLLCVTDDYLHSALADLNRDALARGQRWMLVKPTGPEHWIGPAFQPGETACWSCLAHRLRWHRRVALYAADAGHGKVATVGRRDGAMVATLAEAAGQLQMWIASGGVSALTDVVMSTDQRTLERRRHVLTRRPQCPDCGASVVAKAKRLDFVPRPKVSSEGGHRVQDIDTVTARLERHLSPITGIVGALTPGLRSAAPTFAADHNFSDMHDDRFVLREGMRRRSGGKGKSVAQARVSALAESLERYCGVHDGTEPRIRARFQDLGAEAILPNHVLGYSDRQFEFRDDLNRRSHKAYWVPEPFDPSAEIDWTPLWSLSTERTRYLPTSMCYYGYQSADPVFGRADSNGCAAGAVLEEAVLQGFLELVERDAVAIWWYNHLQRPGLDLGTAHDPYVQDHLSAFKALGRSVWALDLTADLGIPVVAALSHRLDGPSDDILYGFGCHLDPEIALTRALTELNQSIEAVPVAGGAPDQQSYLGGPDAIRWWTEVRVAETPYLRPDPAAEIRAMTDLPQLSSSDLSDEIARCVKLATSRGIEVLVLDQSRPDVDFSVCKVFAPGLRHFWARFGPGRLYNVPVELGWRSAPTPEGDVNPHVIQF